MAGVELNFKVCSPLKLHSGLTGKKPAIAHICIYPSVIEHSPFSRTKSLCLPEGKLPVSGQPDNDLLNQIKLSNSA